MTTNGDSHMDEYIRTNNVTSHKRSKWLRERKLSTKHYWNESLSSGKSGNDDGSRLVNIGAPLKNDKNETKMRAKATRESRTCRVTLFSGSKFGSNSGLFLWLVLVLLHCAFAAKWEWFKKTLPFNFTELIRKFKLRNNNEWLKLKWLNLPDHFNYPYDPKPQLLSRHWRLLTTPFLKKTFHSSSIIIVKTRLSRQTLWLDFLMSGN